MKRIDWTTALLTRLSVAMFAISAVLNVGLVMKLDAVEEKARPGLHAGDSVPPIEPPPAYGLSGESTVAAVPTVIYHFSVACGWCERNWANVEALARQTKGRFRVVGVSIAPLPEGFAAARGITFPLVSSLPDSIVAAYKLAATPQSIMVGLNGRVAESWFGAYSGSFAKEIESFFKVRLPGLEERKRVAER